MPLRSGRAKQWQWPLTGADGVVLTQYAPNNNVPCVRRNICCDACACVWARARGRAHICLRAITQSWRPHSGVECVLLMIGMPPSPLQWIGTAHKRMHLIRVFRVSAFGGMSSPPPQCNKKWLTTSARAARDGLVGGVDSRNALPQAIWARDICADFIWTAPTKDQSQPLRWKAAFPMTPVTVHCSTLVTLKTVSQIDLTISFSIFLMQQYSGFDSISVVKILRSHTSLLFWRDQRRKQMAFSQIYSSLFNISWLYVFMLVK